MKNKLIKIKRDKNENYSEFFILLFISLEIHFVLLFILNKKLFFALNTNYIYNLLI